MRKAAHLSPCGRYRHVLTRVWDDHLPLVAFCGLNPSTADATHDDPTMRREIAFARRWGYGGLVKVNAYDWRATQPKSLASAARRGEPVVSSHNELWLELAVDWTERLVCCWGTHVDRIHGYQERQAQLLRTLQRVGCAPHILRLTSRGYPEHTLYLPGELEPQPWRSEL